MWVAAVTRTPACQSARKGRSPLPGLHIRRDGIASDSLFNGCHERLKRRIALQPRGLDSFENPLGDLRLRSRMMFKGVDESPFLLLEDGQLQLPECLCCLDVLVRRSHCLRPLMPLHDTRQRRRERRHTAPEVKCETATICTENSAAQKISNP